LVPPQLVEAFSGKIGHRLEHPVHDRDELSELAGIMVGFARLL
jgi:hypothetical protein